MNFVKQLTLARLVQTLVREEVANVRYERPYHQTPKIIKLEEEFTINLPSFFRRTPHNEIQHRRRM